MCTLGLNLFRALIVYLKPSCRRSPRAPRRCWPAASCAGRAAAPLLGQDREVRSALTRVELATVESLTKPAPTEANAV